MKIVFDRIQATERYKRQIQARPDQVDSYSERFVNDELEALNRLEEEVRAATAINGTETLYSSQPTGWAKMTYTEQVLAGSAIAVVIAVCALLTYFGAAVATPFIIAHHSKILEGIKQLGGKFISAINPNAMKSLLTMLANLAKRRMK